MILYLIISQVDSCYSCICGPLNLDTKDIVWMDGRVLIITYESLVMVSLKHHILDIA